VGESSPFHYLSALNEKEEEANQRYLCKGEKKVERRLEAAKKKGKRKTGFPASPLFCREKRSSRSNLLSARRERDIATRRKGKEKV